MNTIIFTVIIPTFLALLILIWLLFHDHKMCIDENYKERERFKGASIGSKVRFIKGEHFEEIGTIVDYGLAGSLDIKLDDGEFVPMVFSEELELLKL